MNGVFFGGDHRNRFDFWFVLWFLCFSAALVIVVSALSGCLTIKPNKAPVAAETVKVDSTVTERIDTLGEAGRSLRGEISALQGTLDSLNTILAAKVDSAFADMPVDATDTDLLDYWRSKAYSSQEELTRLYSKLALLSQTVARLNAEYKPCPPQTVRTITREINKTKTVQDDDLAALTGGLGLLIAWVIQWLRKRKKKK